jgi:SAM-dependent methyltransferase
MSEDRGASVPKAVDPAGAVPDLGALDRESSPDPVSSGTPGTPEARAGARRRARTLRIPDDEVARPTTSGGGGGGAGSGAAGRSEPPPAVQPSRPPPVAANTLPVPPLPPPPSGEGAVVMPMRIITINPVPPADSPPPPVAVPPSAPPPKVDGEDSWTPFQPTARDGQDGNDVARVREAAPTARLEMASEELIPIETDVPVPVDDAPLEPPPPSGEPIDPFDDEVVAAAAPSPAPSPVQPPPARALSPTEPEGEEVRFEDDAPTPATPTVTYHSDPIDPADGERRSDPGAEIGVEDVVAVEHPEAQPSAQSAAQAAQAKLVANLPPMRPRLDSKPPLPPPKKKTEPKLARPPLVIVPPHGGTLTPVSDVPGTRRKGRLWWEDLFNDDYLRACEKLTDEQIAREVDFVEDSLSIERGGTVLDLACGTGRHAVELSRRGYEVVGFDLSLAMLARAGDEAQDREAKLNFIQGDMREMTFEEQFDGVYCWNTSFGYFEEEKNAQVIDRIHRALKSEGLLLLDVVNRDFLIRQSPSLAWFEGDGCVCMDEMNVDFITSRMKIKRTIMLDDGRSREIEYSLRVYSLHELGRILHEHGFKVCEVSGRIATPSVFFGNESPRTIILAEKR